MIATGAGVHEHYLSEGGNANRATASEMGLPAIKRFQRRQEYLRGLLTRVVRRALDAQVAAGRLSARADRRFTVTFDELVADSRDVRVAWLSQATDALATATDRGWVSGTEARRLWWRLAGDADAVAMCRDARLTHGVQKGLLGAGRGIGLNAGRACERDAEARGGPHVNVIRRLPPAAGTRCTKQQSGDLLGLVGQAVGGRNVGTPHLKDAAITTLVTLITFYGAEQAGKQRPAHHGHLV